MGRTEVGAHRGTVVQTIFHEHRPAVKMNLGGSGGGPRLELTHQLQVARALGLRCSWRQRGDVPPYRSPGSACCDIPRLRTLSRATRLEVYHSMWIHYRIGHGVPEGESPRVSSTLRERLCLRLASCRRQGLPPLRSEFGLSRASSAAAPPTWPEPPLVGSAPAERVLSPRDTWSFSCQQF